MKIKITKKVVFKIFIVLIALIFISNLTILLRIPGTELNLKLILDNTLSGILIGGAMGFGIILIGNYLEKKYPWLENPVKRLIFQLAFTIGYCLLIIILVILAMKFLFNNQISSVVLWSNMLFMVKIAMSFLLVSLLITSAIQFFINWKKSVVIQEELKREQLALQFETLKNQINPHFLFNSLNSVTSLIKKNPDKAIEFVKKLSEVLRYLMEQKDNEIITIDAELEFLKKYIFLQKIRFGSNLKIIIDVDDKTGYIIPLSLQMLIENSIKHNVISKEFPLTIEILQNDCDYLLVRNNLKKKPAIKGNGIGLENIRSRYEFFTTKKMKIEESETHFTVEIPVIKK